MEMSFLDVRSPQDPRWPQLHEAAIMYAYTVAEPDRDPWCLFTVWRPEFPLLDNWGHHAWVSKQLPSDTDVQTLVAHYRDVPRSRTRIEPWIFAARDVDRSFAESMLRRHRQDLVFWSDGVSLHALTPQTSRCLGEQRPSAIAHAIVESSPGRASFLAFDLPVNSWTEALARTACVGADVR